MIKMSVIVMTLLFCLLPFSLCAAEKDADGCKDHPLIPRMPGYYIAGCNESPAGADLDIIKENITESVRFEGNPLHYPTGRSLSLQQNRMKPRCAAISRMP
jgi:hypothetical protein